MAQEGFKRISVTAAEEDDIVINAGIVKPFETVASDAPEEGEIAQTDSQETESDQDLAPDTVQGTASEDGSKSDDRTEKLSETQRSKSTSKGKQDDYHEATLQDLQGEPMSITQKAVIIAAVVCIIGAVIYYAAFLM